MLCQRAKKVLQLVHRPADDSLPHSTVSALKLACASDHQHRHDAMRNHPHPHDICNGGSKTHSWVIEVNMVGWSHALRLPPMVLKDRFLKTQCAARESTSLSACA